MLKKAAVENILTAALESGADFAELEERLDIKLEGEPNRWFQTASYTQGGGVQSIEAGGKSFSGTEIRSMLGLRSTAFTVKVAGEGISITTRGFGHRVGMSQYGADFAARQGSSYEEILKHYYKGVTIK